jgi:hypothetical protein
MKPFCKFVRLVLAPVVIAQAVLIDSRIARQASVLRIQASAEEGPLFPVNVAYDWQTHDPTKGITIVMDANSGALKATSGISTTRAAAWGYMKEELSKDGWIKLFVQTTDSSRVPNDIRMYAAGFVEGLLSAVRISQFYSNSFQTLMKDENNAAAINNLKRVFEDELKFVQSKTNIHAGTASVEPADPYWKQIRYQYMQMWALKDAYNFVAAANGVRQLSLLDFMFINSHAELPELLQAYAPDAMKKRPSFLLQGDAMNPARQRALRGNSNNEGNATSQEADHDWEERLSKNGHCSALVRLASENKDLFVGHTTWGDYGKMTRIFKYYHFDLAGANTKAKLVGFSSYPGCISSTDSFYMLNSGLVVMDTSLEILNANVYDRVSKNNHVPDFMHIMAANRMASSAAHWAVLFSEVNSGTGNSQWMIIDYNRFVPSKPIPDGTLWVLEQVPGITMKKDMTSWLRDKGYWASYNRPYFEQTRTMSGHTEAEKKHGALYSYENGPRASILKKVTPLSEHLMDMRGIMNRNMWQSEGIPTKSPGHAISARMDLSFSKIPNGGIDAKVANRCLFRAMQCQAISGPSHDSQKIFKWKGGDVDVMKGWPHLGLPDTWDFNWVQMTPTAPLSSLADVESC